MYSEPPSLLPHGVSVRALLDDSALGLNVRLVGGAAGLGREIRHPRIQKSGLALVGHVHGVVPSRIQVLGETEISYAESLTPEAAAARGGGVLLARCVLCDGHARGRPAARVL